MSIPLLAKGRTPCGRGGEEAAMITSTQQGGCRPATGRSGALVRICLGRRGTSPAVVSLLPPARTATAKPPSIDDQNYGGGAGVVAAMSRRDLVWTAGGLRGEEADGE